MDCQSPPSPFRPLQTKWQGQAVETQIVVTLILLILKHESALTVKQGYYNGTHSKMSITVDLRPCSIWPFV